MSKYSSGLQPIIDDLSKQCTEWMNSGAKPCNNASSKFYVSQGLCYVTSGNYHFSGQTFWTGAGIYPFQEEELAAFCRRNNLDYYLSGRQTKTFFVKIIASSPEILKKSELLDHWRQSKQKEQNDHARVARLIPLAEKFYHSDVCAKMIDFLVNWPYYKPHWEHAWVKFTYTGISYHQGGDGYGYHNSTFSSYGYRDLSNDDELVAFVIACMAKSHKPAISPAELKPQYLSRIQITETAGNQRCVMGMPTYVDLSYYEEKLRNSPPPTKKDFF